MATIQETLSLAVQYHQTGRLAEAGGLYRCVLDAQPDHPDAMHLLGLVLFHSGDAEQAIDLMNRALALNPMMAHAFYNLGNILKSQGKPADALEQFNLCLRLLPDFAPAHAGLGSALAMLGRNEEAVEALARARELNPQDINVSVHLANLLNGLGRIDEALDVYSHVVTQVPGNDRLRMSLASLQKRVERFAEATENLYQAIHLNPGNAAAHDELGQLLEALRVWGAASDAYSAALRLRPDDDALRMRLGKALRNAGRTGAAEGVFLEAAARGSSDGEAFHQLGLIRREAGRLEEAVADFRRALEVQPRHAPAHFHLGVTLRLLGRDAEAFADPAAFGELYTTHGDTLAAQGRLKDACAYYNEALLFRPHLDAARRRLHEVLAQRRALCRGGNLSDKEHTDEWGNVELYEAMDKYNRALVTDPRLVGVPPAAVGAAAPATRPRVFDCFTFYNELDLLEMRLEELYDHVDAFVVVEAPWTFQGQPKPLVLRDNLARFERFRDKLVHVVVAEEDGTGPSAWDREQAQRNAILKGLEGRAADGDVIFIADVDEIPRKAAIDEIRRSPVLSSRLNRLSVDYYCCFLDFRCNYKWHKPVALPYSLLRALGPDHARFQAISKYGTLLYGCGWHFSWLGGIERVIGKLRSYAHSEYSRLADQGPERIREAMGSGRGIFALMDSSHGYAGEFSVVPVDDSFPDVVRRDPERFRRLGWFYDSLAAPAPVLK